MADFTLNAPGTTNSPWSPTNVLTPVAATFTIKSDSTGFRSTAAGDFSEFAHNVTYGTTITTTATIASGGASNGDEIWLGAVVRSGANAGAGIGVVIGAFGCQMGTWTGIGGTGGFTAVSTNTSITRANTDVWSVTVAISGGTATVTCTQNGTARTFNVNTTTNFTGEASLAAGAAFNAQNNDSLYLSQFTGTGVSASSFTLTADFGAYTMTGEAASLTTASAFLLLANSGTYNYIGASSNSNYQVDAVTGLYTLAGIAATLSTGGSTAFVLLANPGIYAIFAGSAALTVGNATPIATPQCITNFEIIADAYQLIGVIDENSPPSNEQGVTGLSVLNDYLLNEAADGMRLGWFRQYVLQACTPLKDEDIYGVKILLALQLAARYGITIQNQQLLEAGMVAKTQLVKRSLRYSEADFSEFPRPQGGPWGGPNWI